MKPRAVTNLALTALLLAGCGATPQPASTPPTPVAPAATPPTDPCAAVITQMTPRERLAQLLVVGISPSDPAGALNLVRSAQVGGVFIGGNSTNLLRGNALEPVQSAARWGLSVAVDEEGGRVQRIDQLDGPMPSARRMARTMTVAQVREAGEERGKQLRARGVTVDFAPSLDVSSQPDDGPIGDRSFSSDPAQARDYGLAFAAGLRDGGVTPVFKHFPGHGHAQGDSHEGAVTTPPLSSLRGNDLLPYEAVSGFAGGEVMVGHLTVPGLTGGQPASLSPAAYRLLRADYRFAGPVLTDDLGAMRAITSSYRLPDAVLHALLAGADQALWSSGGNVDSVLDRLTQAQASGELPACTGSCRRSGRADSALAEHDLFGRDGQLDRLPAHLHQRRELGGVPVGHGEQPVVAGVEVVGEPGQRHAPGLVQTEVVHQPAEQLRQDHQLVTQLRARLQPEPRHRGVGRPHTLARLARRDGRARHRLPQVDVEQ
jgi:beta-N-acetylhexosaminidase